METVLDLPDNPFRHTVIIVLREKLGIKEETEYLIDWTEDMWDTIDTLIAHFGEEETHKIIHAQLGLPPFVGEAQ